jgi:transmembrane sensor
MKKMMQDIEADQARIDAEAADWLVRRGEGALGPEDKVAFERWSASDPRRARTFAAMSRTWREASELKHLVHLVEPESPGWLGRVLRAIVPRPFTLQAAALAIAGIAVLAISGSLLAEFLQQHQTGIGQTRLLRLSDGSTVVLGARSTVIVKFTARERLVRLTAGEALFEVKHNAGRPFVVDAGNTVIRDVGTRFDVNRAGGSVRVAVLEGEVEVRELNLHAVHLLKMTQFLKAGDSLEAIAGQGEDQLQPGSVALRPIEPVAATAWREGRLVYQNVRLADVIADVNRYYAPGVALDPASADLRVTASFRTNQIPAFLNTLDSALPVRIDRQGDGRFEVSRR